MSSTWLYILFYSIKNPKHVPAGTNRFTLLHKDSPLCFVRAAVSARFTKASSNDNNFRLFSLGMGMYSLSIFYKTWSNACSSCEVAIRIVRETGADELDKQLTIEENHDYS